MKLRTLLIISMLLSGMYPAAVSSAPGKPVLPKDNEAVTFTNVSEQAGLPYIDSGHATFAWGDYNNDGYIDLLIDTVHGPLLYRNNGPPNWDFTNVTSQVGLYGPGMGNSVFADYDNDGYLDIYTTWWEESIPSYTDVLWHNSGPPTYSFTNVTLQAGNVTDIYPGKGNVWGDFDRDGYLDMYVVNWRTGHSPWYKDYYWHNNGNGTFTDMSQEAGIYSTNPPAYAPPPFAGMGVTAGDYNNDGFMDIWVSDLAHKDPGRAGMCDDSLILKNSGPPHWNFTDIRPTSGIPITKAGTIYPKPINGNYYYWDEHHFSAAWADFDNDGDLDIFVPQVKNVPWSHSFLYRNNGNGTFTNVSRSAGIEVWDAINGAWADYNNDGFMDLVADGKYPYEGGVRQVRLFWMRLINLKITA